MIAPLKQEGRKHRHHGQRQQQRCGQREHNSQRHRNEQLAFQPLQGQQRQEHDDDDGDPGGDRRDDFFHRAKNDMQMRQLADICILRQMRLDVFHHHDRRVHQHADGDGQAAQTHQVGGQAELPHQNESGQHRERQSDRHHNGSAQVAEEQHQQDDDQHDSFGDGCGNGAHGALHQAAAIIKHLGGDALRQRGGEFLQFGLHGDDNFLRIRAAQREHQSLHCFALPVLGHDAIAGQAADAHLRDITDANRIAV